MGKCVMLFCRSALFTFCLGLMLQAQSSQKQIEVDKIFAAFNTHTPGCAVGVANKGAVELRAGYGMADLERNVAITPGTVFESGSVAKQFTAAALMLLAQQGRISLDDPMRKYLPELQAPVTIRQVISHISGIREWRPIAMFGGYPEGKYVYTNEDLLQMASMQKALNFDPGSNYSYSNTGYNISTILIERVSGKTFQQFTHEMIFGPLSMTHTRWREDFRAVIPNRALAYGPLQKGGWTQQTPIENIIGAGGLLTTVGDLLLWNENFVHAKVGGADFVSAQQKPATLANGRMISYAAGLSVGSFETVREVAHSGATGGYRTWLGRYPDQGVSVAVLCNAANANPTALGRATARLWTGSQPPPAAPPFAIANPQKYAGMFRRVRDNTVDTITVKDGSLHFGSAKLTATAEGKFTMGLSNINFDSSASRFQMLNSTDDVLYERVEQAQPTATELAAFVGKYASGETGAAVTVSEGSKPGELKLRVGGELTITLKPTFKDAFESNSGMAIRFLRDSSGTVTGMSAGESRVWDLRFTRSK
jgi:CubicO group peptidase (beta-lactamase class C family)